MARLGLTPGIGQGLVVEGRIFLVQGPNLSDLTGDWDVEIWRWKDVDETGTCPGH